MQASQDPGTVLAEIADFIKANKIASICCVTEENTPYSFSCFYSFDVSNQLLFFKSSSDTFHGKLLLENPKVSGTILPTALDLLAIQGIQFTGTILYDSFPGNVQPGMSYHKTYPFALAKPGHVWCIQLEQMKMTDNSRVFGRKINWVKRPC